MAAPTHVLIIHHRELMCQGLRALIEQMPGFQVLAVSTRSTGALELVTRTKPDLLLTEPHLPDGDGIALTRQVRLACPETRVLMIAERWCVADAVRARAAGAGGFVSSAVDKLRLVAALTKLLAEGRCAPFDRSHAGLDSPMLSAREIEVLEQMRQGRSNIEIGIALHISAHTVLTHAKSLFTKLGVASRAEAVSIGFEAGYLRPATEGRADGTWRHR